MRFNDFVSTSMLLLCIGLCCIYRTTFCQETSPIGSVFSSMKTPSTTTTTSWPTKNDGGGGGGGSGGGCQGTVCPPDRYCVDNTGSGTSCICYEICAKMMAPVCGSNFVTYDNVCELYKDSCSSSANITIIFRGKCVDAKLDNQNGEGNQANHLMASNATLLGIVFLFMMR